MLSTRAARAFRSRAGRALFVCVLLLVTSVAAADPGRVVVVRPVPSGPILDEALIRIRGELSAVGLGVEVRSRDPLANSDAPAFGPLDFGAVVLSSDGSRIEIRAHAPGLDSPVVQWADTAHPGVDAEVVAIRAVEALRAAMVQYARRMQAQREALPKSVAGFTKLTPTEPVPAEEEEAMRPSEPLVPAPPGQGLAFSLSLGGTVTLDMPSSQASLGGEAALFLGRSWYRAGIAVDRTGLAGQLEEVEGTAWVRRTAVTARVRGELEVAEDLFVLVGAGVGAADYRFESVAAPGFSSSDGQHLSPLLSLDTGAAYWFVRGVGGYVSLRADLSTDAPELRFASRDVTVLDRPGLSAAAGIIVGRF